MVEQVFGRIYIMQGQERIWISPTATPEQRQYMLDEYMKLGDDTNTKGEKIVEGYKGLLSSKTFWGAVLAVISAIAGLLGFTFGPDEQAMIIEAVSTIGTGVGSIIAVYGRVVATKKIG